MTTSEREGGTWLDKSGDLTVEGNTYDSGPPPVLPPSLDAAWKAAEDALPEGGRLHLQRRAEAETITLDNGRTWVARQGRDPGAYEAWATGQSRSLGFAYAATPAEALQALATKLRDRAQEASGAPTGTRAICSAPCEAAPPHE